MASNFEFGIGIGVDPASVGAATKAIGGVISNVDGLKNSMASVAGIGLDQIFKGFDPSLLMPNNDAIEESAEHLREIRGILAGLAGVTTFDKTLQEADKSAGSLADTLQEASGNSCGVNACLEEVDTSLQEASKSTKGWAQSLEEIPKLMGEARAQSKRVSEAAALITNNVSQLEFAAVKSEAALGRGRGAVVAYGKSIYDTSNALGVSWENVNQLGQGLRAVSVDFNTTTKAGKKQFESMALLSDAFGLSAQEVAGLAGTMKATGGSLDDLTADALVFQKKFQVPGLINQLPAAAKGAMRAQAEFGTLVGKSSREITSSVMSMAGTYSRALGVTAAEAAQKALGSFMKFTAEVESYEDLFLGLSDSFSPLQTAFLETGMGMEDMQDLMRKGQQDPAAFAEEVKRMQAAMDPQMAERFFRQVLRNSDEGTKAYLTQSAAAREAAKANEEAGKVDVDDPTKIFDKMASAMRSSALDAQAQREALDAVGKEMGRFVASEGVAKGIQAVNDLIRGRNTLLSDGIEKLRGNTEAYATFTSTTAAATTALVGLDQALKDINGVTAMAGGLFGGAAAGAGLLATPFKLLGKTIGPVFKNFKGFGKLLGKLALPIGIAIAAFDNVVDAVKNMGKIISDPNMTGMEKFKGIVGEVLGAAWGTFSDFFLGLPQMFVDGFINVGKKTDTEGTRSIGKAIGNVLGSVMKAIGTFFGTTIPDYMRNDGVPALTTAWESFSFVDDILWPALSGLAAIGDHILDFFGGVFTGIGEAFGVDMGAMQERMSSWWKFTKFVLNEAATYWGDVLTEIGLDWTELVTIPATGAMLDFKDMFGPLMTEIGFYAEKAALAMKAGFLGAVSVIAGPIAFLVDEVILGSFERLLDGVNMVIGSVNNMIESLPTAVRDKLGLGETLGYVDKTALQEARKVTSGVGDSLLKQADAAVSDMERLDDKELDRRRAAGVAERRDQRKQFEKDELSYYEARQKMTRDRELRAKTSYDDRMQVAMGVEPSKAVTPVTPVNGGALIVSPSQVAERAGGSAASPAQSANGVGAVTAAAKSSTTKIQLSLNPGANNIWKDFFAAFNFQMADQGTNGIEMGE